MIAGFGGDDKFPSLYSYKVGGIVGDRLIYSEDNHYKHNRISSTNKGKIFPFGQGNLIQTFLAGIDPTYEEKIIAYFEQKVRGLCKDITDTVSNTNDEERRRLQQQIERKIGKAKKDWHSHILNLGFRRSIPIEIGIVPVLPKDELAMMAETLVSLTSFERRISPGREIVGGPIDVAVISKADGFVWVKKKRYFTREMNLDHMEGYNGKS